MYLKTSNLKFSTYGSESEYRTPLNFSEVISEIKENEIINSFYISNEPVYLNLIDGIGQIIVSNDCDKYERFSFYRSLKLKPGTAFNFACISGHVKYATSFLSLREEKSRKPIKYKKIKHNIDIYEIMGYYYFIRKPNYELVNQVHDFWEIYFIDYGQIIMKIDDIPYILQAKHFIFFAPNQKCSINTKILGEPCSYMKILFRAKLNDAGLLKNHIFTMSTEIKRLLDEYIKISNRNHYTDDDLMLSYLKIIISLLIRGKSQIEQISISESNPLQEQYNEELFNSILSFVEKNIRKPLTLKDLCDEFNVGKGVIYKQFEKQLNTSPIKYINKQRLTFSAKLIKSNEYTITEISQMLGYTSVHYFSRQFKLFYGISPKEYAKTIYY